MAREADVTQFASIACSDERFDCATIREDAFRVVHPKELMDLHEADAVCLEHWSDSSRCFAAAVFVRPSSLVFRKALSR